MRQDSLSIGKEHATGVVCRVVAAVNEVFIQSGEVAKFLGITFAILFRVY